MTTTMHPAIKFILLERGDPSRISCFDTESARNRATLEAIFGNVDIMPTPERAGEALTMLSKLANDGRIDFEGDPSIEWFEAIIIPSDAGGVGHDYSNL